MSFMAFAGMGDEGGCVGIAWRQRDWEHNGACGGVVSLACSAAGAELGFDSLLLVVIHRKEQKM